jgi:hypothetical protein
MPVTGEVDLDLYRASEVFGAYLHHAAKGMVQ